MKFDFFQNLLDKFELPLTNPVLIFSVILLIILLSPILLKRLRAPSIIGLIISGVIIGPYGFNILEKNSAVDLFSTIGLLYIMFIAGLNLDMNEFKEYKYKSLTFGILTFILPFSIGIPVCYYLLNYNMIASILISSMFSTHTLVAYPIVTKFGIAKNKIVAITVGGTILTDTAVLIILSIIKGSVKGGLTTEFWVQLVLSLIILNIIMFLLVPRMARYFFKRLEGERTSHYIFVLSIVFFAAFLAEISGLEPIIGAFIAGLALNKVIPYSSALMNRIKFVGNAIFIPFFLISVGMIVDVTVLLKGPTALIIALILSVVALTGKWIAAHVTQLIFKFSATQRLLIFGLSSSHAAATLAVILIGYKAGIIDVNILNGTIILILVTCIVASFTTEAASKKTILVEQVPSSKKEESEFHKQQGSILVPVSDFEDIQSLLDFSVLIKDKKSSYPINILSVLNNDADAEKKLIKVKQELEDSVSYATSLETKINTIVTIDYNVAGGIMRASRETMANIIVMGWPGKESLLDKIFGQKVENIIETIEKNIFLCNIKKSLNTSKRIVLNCPQLAELEDGFEYWLRKVNFLANELNHNVLIYCSDKTKYVISKYLQSIRSKVNFSYQETDNFDDFLALSKDIRHDDIVIIVSARKNSVSYQIRFENIFNKINKQFPDNNILLVYPMSDYTKNMYTISEPENEDIEITEISNGKK